MKKTLTLIGALAFLAACATQPATEASPAAEADAATSKPESAMEDCDPADPDCDHTGTVFRPPSN